MPPVRLSYTVNGVKEKEPIEAKDTVWAVLKETPVGRVLARTWFMPEGVFIHRNRQIRVLESNFPDDGYRKKTDRFYRGEPLIRSKEYQTEEGEVIVTAEFIERIEKS